MNGGRSERNGQKHTQEAGEGTAGAPCGSQGAAGEPTLLAGGNPQIAKGYGDAPVQAYIAAMPGWKSDLGRRLDALIVRTVPGVRKAVKWNSPLYGVEDQVWFLSFHCFTKYVKVRSSAARRCVPSPRRFKQQEVRYLDIHEDDRSTRPSSPPGQAGQPVARRTNVSGNREVRAGVGGRQVIGPQASRLPGWGQGLKTATAANRPRRPHLELSCQ